MYEDSIICFDLYQENSINETKIPPNQIPYPDFFKLREFITCSKNQKPTLYIFQLLMEEFVQKKSLFHKVFPFLLMTNNYEE